MSSFQAKWNTLCHAWNDHGTRGVIELIRHKIICTPQIRKMQERQSLLNMQYDIWFRESLPGQDEIQFQHDRLFSHRLSYLIPTYNTRPDLLNALAESLIAQTCESWEACIYDGASSDPATIEMLKSLSQKDERFHIVFGKDNLGISGNTNKALALANTDYVALCDHDDLLTPDCTYWILDAAERGADMIYSDEDKTNEDGSVFYQPHFKPDFSPDALRSGNYICHVMAISTSLIRSLAGLRPCCDGSQDHDLALRASEQAEAIAHIPKVLYHWRMLNTSFSHSSSERCSDAATRAVNDQLTRLQLNGQAKNVMLQPCITYAIPSGTTISLIIHSLDGGFDARWARKLLKSAQEGSEQICEIMIVGDNPGIEQIMEIPVHTAPGIHEAGEEASGQCLLFIEQGTVPAQKDWLERLTMFATRPWIACSGAPIIDKKQNYLFCGYAVDVPGCALRLFQGENRFGPTYQLYDRKVRECTAVSSACMMVRRRVFLRLGGFDGYKSDLGSVALGLKAIDHGLSSVTIPEAVCTAPKNSILYDGFGPSDIKQFQCDFPAPVEHYYSPHFERTEGRMNVDVDLHRNPMTVITKFDHSPENR